MLGHLRRRQRHLEEGQSSSCVQAGAIFEDSRDSGTYKRNGQAERFRQGKGVDAVPIVHLDDATYCRTCKRQRHPGETRTYQRQL